jgi:hypothetical protein
LRKRTKASNELLTNEFDEWILSNSGDSNDEHFTGIRGLNEWLHSVYGYEADVIKNNRTKSHIQLIESKFSDNESDNFILQIWLNKLA